MEAIIEPKVTLVGAGPGSHDLITVRGLQALKQSKAILYDALVSPELLKEVDPVIPKIYVGKRCNSHSRTQDEINRLLVETAFQYGFVVRLKGGDPFVFGRASEEIDYVTSFGIPVTVVPGVSSAIAVPASQGIPLTSRGISSSFWVMTATKRDGTFSEDLEYAAKSTATLVILMGVRKLNEIAAEVSKYRGSHTPIALIQNGTMSNETCTVSTLNGIGEAAHKVDPSQPGIIVIGNVVAEHPAFFEEAVQRVVHSYL